jgi:hypothetical protein
MLGGGEGSGGGTGQSYIENLSDLFARLGVWSYDHRWIVFAASLAAGDRAEAFRGMTG